MKRFGVLLVFFLCAASSVAAQQPAAAAPASVAIKAGKVLDVRTGSYALDQVIWVEAGKIKAPVDIVEGFENMPKALEGLFAGKNKGKLMVRV